jgi:hypothetical protein
MIVSDNGTRIGNASDAGDFNVEHEIYREDVVLDYPKWDERIRVGP